jgi:hypothetical protein
LLGRVGFSGGDKDAEGTKAGLAAIRDKIDDLERYF